MTDEEQGAYNQLVEQVWYWKTRALACLQREQLSRDPAHIHEPNELTGLCACGVIIESSRR